MRLLLDTHALLWFLGDDRRLSAATADLIEATGADVLVSIVSLWEIAIKAGTGKLDVDVADVVATVGRTGFGRLGVEVPHVLRVATLTRHHRDPFDHLLVAQAIVENARFVTADPQMAAYPVERIACR